MINRYAKINSENIIENIILCDDSNISSLNGVYVKIEERHLTACGPATGDEYFPAIDKFKEKQWWDSWTWDEELWKYIPPAPKPYSGNWLWDNNNEEWLEVISAPAE